MTLQEDYFNKMHTNQRNNQNNNNNTLSKYIKLREDFHIKVNFALGSGTYGKVFSVLRQEDNRNYAMKVLHIKDEQHRNLSDWEARVGSLIHSHKNTMYLVGILCHLKIKQNMYLIMEMLETDLWKLISEYHNFSPFNVLQIRNIAWQLLTAVDVLHGMGIIHTDIKPENVLIVKANESVLRIKLSDFGTSLRLGTYTCCPKIQSLFYRSPEVLFGLPFNEKIDIWSVGCIMAELYVGQPFYPAIDEIQLANYIVSVQGYPFDLANSKFWSMYFAHSSCGEKQPIFYLKHSYNETEDRRKVKFQSLAAMVYHGYTWVNGRYVSTLDEQFIKDLQLLMCVDRDWRCTADEARSLALFQMESNFIYERYNLNPRHALAMPSFTFI